MHHCFSNTTNSKKEKQPFWYFDILIVYFVCITGTLNCPSECSSDPCSCDEVQNCRDGLCDANGCDLCEDGYFKKDYNYHCAQCQQVFGDDCMHCTDFLGCQQCQTGTRTYDSDCGLYYCKDPEC